MQSCQGRRADPWLASTQSCPPSQAPHSPCPAYLCINLCTYVGGALAVRCACSGCDGPGRRWCRDCGGGDRNVAAARLCVWRGGSEPGGAAHCLWRHGLLFGQRSNAVALSCPRYCCVRDGSGPGSDRASCAPLTVWLLQGCVIVHSARVQVRTAVLCTFAARWLVPGPCAG